MRRRKAGLCTIALQETPLVEVIRIASDAGASAVEVWGQPPHVSYPVDRSALESARNEAVRTGVEIVAFGSYFQPGKEVAYDGVRVDVQNQIEAANALGARLIRIWAGSATYDETREVERHAVYDSIRAFGDKAGTAGMGVVLERHSESLTHGWDAPLQVLDEIARRNVSLNYQIPYPESVDAYKERSVNDYRTLLPRSSHAHLQNYTVTNEDGLIRTLLKDGIIDYSELGQAARVAGYDGCFMVEFPAEARGELSIVEAIADDVAFIESLSP